MTHDYFLNFNLLTPSIKYLHNKPVSQGNKIDIFTQFMGNIIFLLLVLASFFGLSKLFVKAGIEGWKGWVPVYNFYVLSKLLGKPWWWCLIMIVPGVNIIMYGVYGFNVARAFNKPSNSDLLFASVLPYIFFVKLGFDDTAKFVGLDRYKTEPNRFIKNWVDPIIFAVIAASIIRGYFIEAFTIPTSSLEKSLLVGDFLFVNKFAYGPKIPQTPLSFPFAHHTLPFTEATKSYLEWIKLPYFRLPGFGQVQNNQIVVFNYPDGDTVALGFQDVSYYQLVRSYGYENVKNPSFVPAHNNRRVGKIASRPVDKRDHYVKRCVGIAGDTLQIVNGELFINNVKQQMPERAQHNYFVKAQAGAISLDEQSPINPQFLDKLDIYIDEAGPITRNKDTIVYILNMPADVAEQVKVYPGIFSVEKLVTDKDRREFTIFPHNPSYPWNNDNFGPLFIPRKGFTIPIDTHNICLYKKIINTYDNGLHQVTTQGGQVLYDGKPLTSYTFKQDYYFMMGDNRHNSADSRSWGFVPFDHIVGSPFFVWFSMKYAEKNPVSGKSVVGSLFKNSKDGKFRWERFLCYVKDGTLHSVKIPFILAVLAIWGFNKWNNRRRLRAGTASVK
jgi:signal peptidase I